MMDMCRRGNVVSVDGANDMIGKKTIVLHDRPQYPWGRRDIKGLAGLQQ
jgi:hypothetical protein